MKVSRFRVEKYRSIERSESIDLSTLSILVGPNNEGKSNILRALVVGLRAIDRIGQGTARPSSKPRSGVSIRSRLEGFEDFNWERDFPLSLQSKTPGASSIFEYEFSLDEGESETISKEVGHRISSSLMLRVLLSTGGAAELKIVKRGPASGSLNRKIRQVAALVSRRVVVHYVPASRQHEFARDVLRREVLRAIEPIRSSNEYVDATTIVHELLEKAVEPLRDGVLKSVQEFVPTVNSVRLPLEAVFAPRPSMIDVMVDDGYETSLFTKGDGVQSLVSIALIRYLAALNPGMSVIFALEEPEAHLHPGAIRQLRDLLEEVSAGDQVVLTTHNPILVNRSQPAANILVTNNRARPAKSLEEVRSSLGAALPDNMYTADVILIVEGDHDRTLLSLVLARESEVIAAAISDGRLAVTAAGGAAKIAYQYRLFKDAICQVHVTLDCDPEGNRAQKELLQDVSFSVSDLTMLTINQGTSEVEDLFDEKLFADELLDKFNVTIDEDRSHPAKRFAERIKDYMRASGVNPDDSIMSNVKSAFASAVQRDNTPVRDEARPVVEALVRAVERKLS